ncbi:Fe-only nitrogenase accessory AnfO family protein [Methanoregula sp.]|jgi:Fe-only nitrogenase accessory protein AnfO|uniref:Fe-only nitrogenase accessory AnfO family protein n=1 Tax=Methanoregula sp. TaxID=2052170 RepID=UPI003C27094C
MMADEIAVVLGENGSSSSLNEPGTIVVFARTEGSWEKDREMPLVLDPDSGLKGMREKMADIMGFLGSCRIIATTSASGAPYFELEKSRCSIWEISGKPGDFLNQVWADEEREMAKERTSLQTREGSRIPVPLEKTPGTFYISIKEVQGKRPDISSKQVLQQFIQKGGFLILDITCTHVPPWIEVEAEHRGYTLETEMVDNETTRVRLTTSASK